MATLGNIPAMMTAGLGDEAGQELEQRQALEGQLMPPMPFGTQQTNVDPSSSPNYIDPRRALWGGFMADMANHFLSGRRAGFTGQGTRSMFGAIQSNQRLEDRMRQQQLAEQTALNPYKDMPQAYQSFALATQNGYDGDFQQWIQDNRASQSGRPVKTWVSDNGNMWYLDSNGQAIDTNVPGSPEQTIIRDVAGVPYVEYQEPGGRKVTRPLDEWQRQYRTDVIEDETRTEDMAAAFARADAEFELTVPQLYQGVQRQLQLLDELEAAIQQGQYDDTGIVEGRIRTLVDENLAYLQAINIDQTLQQLQAVNLAPVTENEIALLRTLYPDVLVEPEANLGRIRAARRRLQGSADKMRGQLTHYADEGTLRGFGIRQYRTPDRGTGPYGSPGDDDDPVRF